MFDDGDYQRFPEGFEFGSTNEKDRVQARANLVTRTKERTAMELLPAMRAIGDARSAGLEINGESMRLWVEFETSSPLNPLILYFTVTEND